MLQCKKECGNKYCSGFIFYMVYTTTKIKAVFCKGSGYRKHKNIASEFSPARNAFCIIEVREKADKIEIYSVLNNVQKVKINIL